MLSKWRVKMKLLPIPQVDNKAVYKSVLKNKQIICSDKNNCEKFKQDSEICRMTECCKCIKSPRTILKKYEKSVISLYDKYVEMAPNFEKADFSFVLGDELEPELRKTYKNSQKVIEVKKIIFKNFGDKKIGRCPFCKLSEANTLDHYLCESTFPQFIIYAPNLVPCCSDCNSNKGNNLLTDSNERKFFHYYYDEIPEEPILECFVFLSNGELDYSYDVNPNVKCVNADLFRRQFTALSLGKRYQKACVGKLSTLRDELKECYRMDGINGCKTILNIKLKAATRNLGINHYETAMLRGILNNISVFLTPQ